MGEQYLVYVEVHYSTIVKLFTSTRPGNGVVLYFDAKIFLHIPFTMPNVNAIRMSFCMVHLMQMRNEMMIRTKNWAEVTSNVSEQ